jgi:hypothetical protein
MKDVRAVGVVDVVDLVWSGSISSSSSERIVSSSSGGLIGVASGVDDIGANMVSKIVLSNPGLSFWDAAIARPTSPRIIVWTTRVLRVVRAIPADGGDGRVIIRIR